MSATAHTDRFYAIKRLLGELKHRKAVIAVVLFLGLVISAVQPAVLRMTEKVIDELRQGQMSPYLKKVPLIIILIFVVSGFAKYFHNSLRRVLGEEVLVHLRSRLFEKYLNAPISHLDNQRTGNVLSSFQNDLSLISQGLETLTLAMKEPFTFIGLMATAFYCDVWLTLATLVTIPLVVILFSASGSAMKKYSARGLTQFSDLMLVVNDALIGSRIVKAFHMEHRLRGKFEKVQARYFHNMKRSIQVQEIATPAVEFVGSLIIALVFLYGAYRVENGGMTAGKLVSFMIAIGLAQMPIKTLNNAWLKIKGAEAAAERIYTLLDGPEERNSLSAVVRPISFRDRIVFENVGIQLGDRHAVNDVSFELPYGKKVGLVGESGSGKTTLLNSLLRFNDVTSGRVLIDGVNINDLRLEDLRALTAYVTQETFLFCDTIYENIRFGRPEATAREIEKAAEQAHCTDFIGRFPQGFHTEVGERGVRLSGGERQRIAIARAFLKGAPLLLLDEATSNLDSHSEAIVQQALDALMEGRTSLIVAHRLSTVARADQIVVLSQGHMVEQGRHQDLVKSRGRYFGLVEKQRESGITSDA